MFQVGTQPRNCKQAGRFSAVAGKKNKSVLSEGSFMSDNFWDVKLNEKDESAERAKEDDSQRKATTPVPKIEVDLADFPVDTWDSDNDANEIVDWYNQNRLASEGKTLAGIQTVEWNEKNQFDSRCTEIIGCGNHHSPR